MAATLNRVWLRSSLLLYESIRIVKRIGEIMRNTYTEEDYKKKCNELNVLYIGHYKKKKLGTMIQFVCKRHKEKGIQEKDWSHFRTYTYGCSFCSGRNKTTEEVQEAIHNKDVVLISEYLGNEKQIKCRCRRCGNEWTTLPKILMTNKAGCPKCGRLKVRSAETKTKKQFCKDLYNVNPNIEVIGEYINTHTKIKCKCLIDNTEWNAYPANLLNQSAGCPTCNMSIGERKLLNILDSLGIDQISQYKFDNCKYINQLRFDAFSPSQNTAFEFNGQQHYFPVDFGNKGKQYAAKEFELTKLRDRIKKEYCDKNNINLIIIPYWDKDKMEQIIIKNLNLV